MNDRPQCTAIRAAGGRCQSTSAIVAGLCRFHDPDRKAELTAMRQRGQAAAVAARMENRRVRAALASETAGPRPPVGKTLETVSEFVRWVLEAAVRRELTQGELTALTSGARVLDSLYSKVELERALKAAQRELARLKATRG